MSSASVALPAPLTPEPMLAAIRSLAPRPDERQSDRPGDAPTRIDIGASAQPATTDTSATVGSTRVETYPIRWVEPAENLWLLSLKNYGLTLATFGVYHFWGRAEMNRQMINAIEVEGRPLDYTGSGREAFASFVLGALIAVALVSAFAYLFILGPGGGSGNATLEGIRQFRWQRLIISLPLLFLLGSITYRRRHHILRRSWIAGERFRLTGHAWSYAWRHFWSAFTVPLTAGLSAPWRASMLAARKIDEMAYDGGLRFHAMPDLKALYRTYAMIWLCGGLIYLATTVAIGVFVGPEVTAAISGATLEPLKSWAVLIRVAEILAIALLPALATLYVWRKAWLEHQISAIGFDGGRLRLRLPLTRFLALSFGGLALSLVSFGCFKPVARARYLRFLVDHLSVEGQLSLPPRRTATREAVGHAT